MISLASALTLIAERFGLDEKTLISYAEEDNVGGWDNGIGKWEIGSLWSVEGKVLYALVRALRPSNVVEVGTHRGCSATHIASALAKNKHGMLYAIDPYPEAGDSIPKRLQKYVTVVQAEGEAWLAVTDIKPDIIYEDASHTTAQVEAVWNAGTRALLDGGIMISHDSEHFIVGDAVRAGVMRAGIGDFISLLIEPSDCGLLLWQKR